jgi:CHAT domain-containing protein
LPDAERDAGTVRNVYAHAISLARAQATREAFLDHAPRADVVHYAGHAVSHPTVTGLSRLILADSADHSGSLFMSDITRLSFSRTRLVVLAACSTADGRILRGAGTVSLATAFLDAGVPNVIASLWPIEDRQTAALFRAFHEAFSQGDTPEIALRKAQLQLLRHESVEYRRPQAWAAFQSIGSISASR